jgi:hypothetical protein
LKPHRIQAKQAFEENRIPVCPNSGTLLWIVDVAWYNFESFGKAKDFGQCLAFGIGLFWMEEKLRNTIGILILIWLACTASACISEVKPVLKPADVDLPTKIAGQQKQLDLGIATHEFTRDHVQPFQENLNRIKEKYEGLKAREALTPRETENLNRMLDDNSDQIFRLQQKAKHQNPQK